MISTLLSVYIVGRETFTLKRDRKEKKGRRNIKVERKPAYLPHKSKLPDQVYVQLWHSPIAYVCSLGRKHSSDFRKFNVEMFWLMYLLFSCSHCLKTLFSFSTNLKRGRSWHHIQFLFSNIGSWDVVRGPPALTTKWPLNFEQITRNSSSVSDRSEGSLALLEKWWYWVDGNTEGRLRILITFTIRHLLFSSYLQMLLMAGGAFS